MGNGQAPARTQAEPIAAEVAEPPSLAAEDEVPEPIPAPTLASPQPAPPSADVPAEQTDTDLVLVYGDRRYRVRGWKKPLNPEALKVNLLASKAERFHVDSFDLYNAKARAAFVKQAGIELGEAEDVLKHDLGRVLLKLEEVQTEALKAAMTKDDKRPRLSEVEEAEALALLRDPQLLDRILADFAACGVVGEETNKLVGYLAAVSRQLDRPLAVIAAEAPDAPGERVGAVATGAAGRRGGQGAGRPTSRRCCAPQPPARPTWRPRIGAAIAATRRT